MLLIFQYLRDYRHRMPSTYFFVSCDIVAHSAEASIAVQQSHVTSINEIIAEILNRSPENKRVWASGGDGGHLAFPIDDQTSLVFELIVRLRKFSQNAAVPLRIIGCVGPIEIIEGADGRMQLVGHGINLAGRLLTFAGPSQVIVTQEFYEKMVDSIAEDARFHGRRTITVKSFPPQEVYLLSVTDQFESSWEERPIVFDGLLVQQALMQNDFLEVIYRARRLLEVNSSHTEAINALRALAINRIRPQSEKNFLTDLLLDLEFGFEIVSAGTLIERLKGDVLCDYNEEGSTMFIVLKGKLGVFLPKESLINLQERDPDFIVSEGELTGEIAFELRRKRTATLVCLENTSLLALSYDEILRSFKSADTRDQVASILNRKILARILENLWNTAPYLCNKEKAGLLNSLTAPWLTLLPFSKIKNESWRQRILEPGKYAADGTGLTILVSGQLKDEDSSTILDGIDYPILFANFPGLFNKKAETYTLLDDVKLLSIGVEGFLRFERMIYAELVSRIHTTIGDSAHTDELIKENQQRKPAVNGKKHIFLSYSRDNKEEVAKLRDDLRANNFSVWWDEDITGGQNWQQAIKQAMKNSYAVVFCFSAELQSRNKSGVYPEISEAISIYREYSPGRTFLIPVCLSECEIPPIEIDSITTLDKIQRINLFPASKRQDGIGKLVEAILFAMEN
jgi:hypothetical protein